MWSTNQLKNRTETNSEGRNSRQLTFGDAAFYFGDWVNDAEGMIDRAAKSIQRFVHLTLRPFRITGYIQLTTLISLITMEVGINV